MTHTKTLQPVITFLFLLLVMVIPGFAQVILLSEDFESVELRDPFEEPTPPPTPGQPVISRDPPLGWVVDRSGVAGNDSPDEDLDGIPDADGVTDWSGWTFADRDWWFSVDGQRRNEFQRASGVIAVADNDEWDDDGFLINNPGPREPHPREAGDVYTTFLSVPITASGDFPENRVQLLFDSSWRPEFDADWPEISPNGQEAQVTVSFDGGPEIELLKWDSTQGSANFKDDNSTNEQILIDVPNPEGFETMELKFGMINGQNDWWWAVDNVLVQIPAKPATLIVDTGTGEVELRGGDFIEDALTSYTINSANGSLRPQNLNGLSDQIAPSGDGIGQSWDVVNAAEDQVFEAFLFGDTQIDEDIGFSLGRIFNPAAGQDESLTFTYTQPSGIQVEGTIEFIETDPPACDPNSQGDINGDGLVSFPDFLVLSSNFGQDTTEGHSAGDINCDGTVSFPDFLVLSSNFGNTVASEAANVPEPATGILIALATVSTCCLRRRRR